MLNKLYQFTYVCRLYGTTIFGLAGAVVEVQIKVDLRPNRQYATKLVILKFFEIEFPRRDL